MPLTIEPDVFEAGGKGDFAQAADQAFSRPGCGGSSSSSRSRRRRRSRSRSRSSSSSSSSVRLRLVIRNYLFVDRV